MLYLISCGMPEKRSFKIMEAVRKGRGLPEGAEEEMKAAGVPDWYIGSCKKIKYLFPKAHAVAYVMMAFRIAWFKVHHPLAFYCRLFLPPQSEGRLRRGADDPRQGSGGRATSSAIEQQRERHGQGRRPADHAGSVPTNSTSGASTFLPISIYDSHATKFIIKDGKLLPPFVADLRPR